MSDNQKKKISEHVQKYGSVSQAEAAILYPEGMRPIWFTNHINNIYKKFCISDYDIYKNKYDLDKRLELYEKSLIKNIQSR